jgi:superfamily II DNA/RNA helicase
LVFLSTEAGGAGLNLQFSDTVINFDLPWNPAKKNQRIGRVNRIGQESNSITAINMMALDSIEARIADGIVLKQELFNAVLNDAANTDEVDFSAKGRSTFIEQLKQLALFDIPDKAQALPIEEKTAFSEKVEQMNLFGEEEPEAVEETVEIKPSTELTTNVQQGTSNEAIVAREAPLPQQVEETLNNGLQFLSGVFKMATGKELLSEEQSVSVNKETGEVVMKFKLPKY